MNYQVDYLNYIENGIKETDLPVDGKMIFPSFSQAKKCLIKALTIEKTEINCRLKQIRELTKQR